MPPIGTDLDVRVLPPAPAPAEVPAPMLAGRCGTPDVVPLCVPELGGHEWAYVRECLNTGWISSVGAYVTRFEDALARRVGARYAVAMSSGTAALHVALLVAGVEPDDEVVVPALTFIATANAVRYTGAWPVFADVDAEHWQLDVARVERFLAEGCRREAGVLRNRVTGRRVRAILPVHLLGHPADADAVAALARAHGLAVVEDATESLGARCRGTPVGRHGTAACFSFNGNKLITTGGGGMLVTDDATVAARARYLSTQARDEPVEYVHHAVGFNYRLTGLQAAVGVAQLERLDELLAAKRRIAQAYDAALADLPGITLPREAPWAESAWWLYTVRVDPARAPLDSRGLRLALARAAIETRPLWQPLHQSPAHRGAWAEPCPVAERIQGEALSLPCSAGLTAAQQERVVAALRAALRGDDEADAAALGARAVEVA